MQTQNNNSEITNDQSCLSAVSGSDFFPLIIIFWIPQTILVLISLYYHIRWDCLGITDGINPYYTTKFKSSLDSYLWIISEIGYFGMFLFTIIAIGYLWMTKVIVNVIYHYH